jgi:hypothetical protein
MRASYHRKYSVPSTNTSTCPDENNIQRVDTSRDSRSDQQTNDVNGDLYTRYGTTYNENGMTTNMK